MADKVVLDGELSLDIPLDGEAGTVIEVGHDTGIDTIVFNSDYTLTFNMTSGETFTTGSIRGEQGDKGDKGDTGDTYSLTQQDKEDIAGLVDTPVDDVRVNGTSIVSDGVANISMPQTVTVTGTTPTITGQADTRYVCGEVSTLDITTPSSGIIDVVFTSGATATVLTVTPPSGMTMKWANGFDPSSLEANTTYEINVMDGVLGVAGTWT